MGGGGIDNRILTHAPSPPPALKLIIRYYIYRFGTQLQSNFPYFRFVHNLIVVVTISSLAVRISFFRNRSLANIEILILLCCTAVAFIT